MGVGPSGCAGCAINRYGNMQTGWVIWGLMLAGLGLSGLGVAAWMFPGWWRSGERLPTAHRARPDAGTSRPPRPRRPLRASRWHWWCLGGTLAVAPVAMLLGWSAWHDVPLQALPESPESANTQVTLLLQGEHLVPPPPLPPSLFLTAEVVAQQPLLAQADRRWDQMDAAFVQAVLRVFQTMKREHGYDMALLEGWRSPQRQALLAARGAAVTQAGPWQSYHQWGLAADCAFVRDGRLVVSERDPWARRGYALFGEVAEHMGLTWGGRWQMADLGHVEWRKPEVQAAMRAAQR